MGRLLVYVVPLALALYAVIDLSRSAPRERAGIPRWGWVAIVLLLPVIGPVAWLIVSRVAAAERPAPPPAPPQRPTRRRSGPPAPDDDPDFLWRLEQRRRRERKNGADGNGNDRGN